MTCVFVTLGAALGWMPGAAAQTDEAPHYGLDYVIDEVIDRAVEAPDGSTRVCVLDQNGDGSCVGLTRESTTLTPHGDPIEQSRSPASDVAYYSYTQITNSGPNGEPCRSTAFIPLPPVEDPRRAFIGPGPGPLDHLYPDCPAEVAEPGEPETEANFAARYWQGLSHPAPQPYIAPGRAITGLFAYLETRGTTTKTYTEPNTPFGPLHVTATGRYYVDWGDGTRTGPYSKEGEPWPDGDIVHEYINVGNYDVVVTERWTGRWSFGSASGTFREFRTVGRIDDFPVQQIQAVVFR